MILVVNLASRRTTLYWDWAVTASEETSTQLGSADCPRQAEEDLNFGLVKTSALLCGAPEGGRAAMEGDRDRAGGVVEAAGVAVVRVGGGAIAGKGFHVVGDVVAGGFYVAGSVAGEGW